MIRIISKLPKKINIGFSGGVDSVVATRFLMHKHDVRLLYVDHGDSNSDSEVEFAVNFASQHSLQIEIFPRKKSDLKGKSKEHVWSQARHEIFNSQTDPVVTAHHLNDVIETWIVSSLQGKPKIMNAENVNVIRPFLLNSKQKFLDYAKRHRIEWCEDLTNSDSSFAQRNYVRNILMPHALVVNPGLEKTVKKLVEVEYTQNSGVQ